MPCCEAPVGMTNACPLSMLRCGGGMMREGSARSMASEGLKCATATVQPSQRAQPSPAQGVQAAAPALPRLCLRWFCPFSTG